MSRTTNITFSTISSKALNVQKQFDQYGFPFTLNPTVGCSLACKYCYSPIFVAKVENQKRKQFFENIRVKLDQPTRLDKELTKLSVLPQHLKRVQINETSEYYLPKVIKEQKKINRDLMLEILEVFEKQAKNGNKWMLHILTKSNLILQHIDKLKDLKHMVQVEVSFATGDESIRRQIEFYTIPIDKRLKVVEELSNNDIFVRIMAMPFYGDDNKMLDLKNRAFNVGAKAFKNKGLNYYDWTQLKSLTYDDLINDKIERVAGRPDYKNLNLMINSGEKIKNGTTVKVLMPIPKQSNNKMMDWSAISKMNDRLVMTDMNEINCGYNMISKINWDYIK
jgi:DNA repair photolyase